MAFIWFLAQIPTIIPSTQLVRETTMLTKKKGIQGTMSMGIPLMKSTM